jgi:hypothetical protein
MKKSSYYPLYHFLFCVFLSCSKSNPSSPNETTALPQEPNLSEYHLEAILRPLNTHLSGYLPTGKAKIKIQDGLIKVETYLDDDAKVMHAQFVHLGDSCPNLNDDMNLDGVIDFQEVQKVSGEVALPLDLHLKFTENSEKKFPIGPNYTYKKNAPLKSLISEMQKLYGQWIPLNQKAVIIYGVSSRTSLPTTVSTLDSLSVYESVPIACGILTESGFHQVRNELSQPLKILN